MTLSGLHKYQNKKEIIYTFFDSNEKIIIGATSYLRSLRLNKRSPDSQRQVAYVVKLFCKWLENSPFFKGMKIDEIFSYIRLDDIFDWISEQRLNQLSERTIHNREVLIREMFKWFTTQESGICSETPWNYRTLSRSPHFNLPRFVTQKQVIRLLLGMYNESQRAATHFMFDTGVRVSEMIRLTQKQLPKENDYPKGVNYLCLHIEGSKSYDGSQFKMRDTIISRPMLSRIRRYHSSLNYKLAKDWSLDDPEKPVFLNVNGEKLTKDAIYDCIKTAWKRQGGESDEMSPHRLRHGTAYSVLTSEYGKELLDNLIILKGMLGHSDIRTTEIYSSIPIVVTQSLCRKEDIKARYEEAGEIYQSTYLPHYKHTEKRGHKK
jgi:integrase/recombinase XerD